MKRMRTASLAAACLASCVLASPGQAAGPDGAKPGFGLPMPPFGATWPSAGNGPADTHDAPGESLLSPYTIGAISRRWTFTARGNVSSTPTVEGDALFFSDSGGSVWRLDARSGTSVWEAKLASFSGYATSSSRNSPAIGPSSVIVGDQATATVYALSKTDGRLLWRTTLADDMAAIITASPLVIGNRVYVGVASQQEGLASAIPNFVPTFRGSVAVLDLNDGHVVWQTYTVPQGYTGGSIWGSNIAVDLARRVVFVSTGNNYSIPDFAAACQAAATTPAQVDACLPANDHMDSILSLNMDTGAINWGQRFQDSDTWTASCVTPSPATPCPAQPGPDADFGSAPNLFSMTREGVRHDVVGAGEKSGVYWALDRDTGQTLWATQVGPGGDLGGIEWGTATDGTRVYVPSANSAFVDATLAPSGRHTTGGFWSALDVATGAILWQTPTFAPQPPIAIPLPAGTLAKAEGSVSVANGVLYGEDTAGYFVSLDARTGEILKSFQSGGASLAGPAVVDGTLYWGSGNSVFLSNFYGPQNNKLYAFSLGG